MTDITQLIERLRSIAKGNHSCGHGYDSHEHDTFTSSADALESQAVKIEGLRETLETIGDQPLFEELTEEEQDDACFSDGYDELIRTARAKLKGTGS